MLEPLQNYDSRKEFRKQLVRNYKQQLDDQLAHKVVKPRDLVEGNDIKMLSSFVKNDKLDSPIMYPGTNVGDEKIDKALNKFLEKERMLDKSFNVENYDDDVFKRRNLEHIHNKEMIKRPEILSQGSFLRIKSP